MSSSDPPPETPINRNRFKAQRLWPPDFSTMDPKHQFRLERRYRRRAQLAYQRPGWDRWMRLAQWGSISFVLAYAVFFMDEIEMPQPVLTFRSYTREKVSGIWRTIMAPAPNPESIRKSDSKSS